MNRHVTAVLILLLVTGIGIGFLSGYSLGFKSCRPADAPAPVPQVAPTPAPAAPGPPAPAPERPPAASPRAPAREPAGLHEALARVSVQVPEPKQGRGVIRGTVTLESGAPVAGVKVQATPTQVDRSWGRRPPAPADDFELERNILQVVRRHRLMASVRREAVTDKDGGYALENLEDTTYSVNASAKGYEIRTKAAASFNVRPDARIDFSATAMVEVPCSVLLPDGKPPDYAILQYRSDTGQQRGGGWSPQDPVLRLPSGRYEITASSGTRGEFRSDAQTVDVAPPGAPSLTLQLKGRPGIRGKVVFPKGVRATHVTVYASPVSDRQVPDAETLMQSGKQSWASAHDAFSFTITDLAAGDYYLAVVDQTLRQVLAGDTVAVADRMVERDLTVPLPARSAYLVVWAYGPDGKVLTDLTLSTRASPAGGGRASSFFSYGRNEDGSWWVMHPDDPPGKAETRYSVTVSSVKCGSKSVDYLRAARSQVTVRFEGVASLKVRVTGVPPEGDPAKLVVGFRETGQDNDSATKPVPADGVVTFDRLPASSGTLLLYTDVGPYGRGASAPKWVLRKTALTLASGPNEMTLAAPRLYSLTVKVEDPAWGRNIHFAPAGFYEEDLTLYVNLDDFGRSITFNGLPAGQYDFKMVHGQKAGRMTLSVPEQSVVSFDAPVLNAIEVWVKDPQGYLGRAGFETGDIITAINGVPFRQINTVSEILSAYSGMSDVTVTVLRKGSPVNLKANVGLLKIAGPDGRLNATSVTVR